MSDIWLVSKLDSQYTEIMNYSFKKIQIPKDKVKYYRDVFGRLQVSNLNELNEYMASEMIETLEDLEASKSSSLESLTDHVDISPIQLKSSKAKAKAK